MFYFKFIYKLSQKILDSLQANNLFYLYPYCLHLFLIMVYHFYTSTPLSNLKYRALLMHFYFYGNREYKHFASRFSNKKKRELKQLFHPLRKLKLQFKIIVMQPKSCVLNLFTLV